MINLKEGQLLTHHLIGKSEGKELLARLLPQLTAAKKERNNDGKQQPLHHLAKGQSVDSCNSTTAASSRAAADGGHTSAKQAHAATSSAHQLLVVNICNRVIPRDRQANRPSYDRQQTR
jgi:hypothetical protein